MNRTEGVTKSLFVSVLAVLFLLFPARVHAEILADSDYDAVILRARVVDRGRNPVSKARLHFSANLSGIERLADGSTTWFTRNIETSATTDSTGLAQVTVKPLPGTRTNPRWFRGRVLLEVTAGEPELSFMDAAGARSVLTIPTAPQTTWDETPTLTVYERPDLVADGFPFWGARAGKTDRIVVLIEGFDLYNQYSATDNMRLIGRAGDQLRAAGIGILVVNFPDAHLPPDELAPLVAQAIRAAARLSGHKVAVAGLSAGGIAARWALVTAENAGEPLPVHTLMLLDTPNRGANINPALQAITLRYGKRDDQDALNSPAAHTLLNACITDWKTQVHWRNVGLPLVNRAVPIDTEPNTALHDAFFARLHALNDRRGYPNRCRLISVSNSPRRGKTRTTALLHLWLPGNFFWTLPSSPADRVPGSLLPPLYVHRFDTYLSLGIAGAYLRSAPTFLPAASALDADLDEIPPFDSWYAPPDNQPFRSHDDVDPGAGEFVVRELLRADWSH